MYVARLPGLPPEACDLGVLKHLLEGNIQSGLRLRFAKPRLAPRYDVEPAPMRVVEARLRAKNLRLHHHWNPNVRSRADLYAKETALCDAHDIERMIVDADGLPDGVRIAPQAALPEVETQYRHRMRQWVSVVFACEKPSQNRARAHCGEEASR